MVKNIIFDLSEVIISGYHGIEKIIGKNTNISEEEFLKRKQETIHVFLDAMRGKYSEDEYLLYFLEGTNWIDINKENFKAYIRENLNVPVAGTMDIIKKLEKDYNLILLSDHIKEWMEYILENNKEIDIFKHKYFSYEYGKLKSDEGCFKYIIEDRKIDPKETIFIDDYLVNIEMAQKAGIDGIVFKDAETLKKELEGRGIL